MRLGAELGGAQHGPDGIKMGRWMLVMIALLLYAPTESLGQEISTGHASGSLEALRRV